MTEFLSRHPRSARIVLFAAPLAGANDVRNGKKWA
jgi:hypothetical protein